MQSLSHTYTNTHTHAGTHATTLMYGQQPRRHTWVCFRFVDILSGLESGLLWKTTTTRELSLPVGWFTVTGLRLTLHRPTVPDKHDLTGKHMSTHRCQCTFQGQFVYETLNSFLSYFEPLYFFLPEESSQLFSFWCWGCPLNTPWGMRWGGLTGSSVYM